ncbi:MAG: hypothetical protein Kow00109_10000 [Acidobacteriota bacterium]
MLLKQSQLLFVVGPARSGTTFTMAQLNRSDQIFLFSELNSYRLHGQDPRSFAGLVAEFHSRKVREGNTNQKGTVVPNASSYKSVEELYWHLSAEYRLVGEKVAFSDPPDRGWFPVEWFFDCQLEKYFHAYHLFLLRDPIATLHSLSVLFPNTSLKDHYERLLITFGSIFEMSWVLPRTRLLFYERLGEEAFRGVFDWLGLDCKTLDFIAFSPRKIPDWSFRRQQLLREVPGLDRLARIYEALLTDTYPSPYWLREETRAYLSGPIYDRIGSALQGLIDDYRKGRVLSSVKAPHPEGEEHRGPKVVLETLHPLARESSAHLDPMWASPDDYSCSAFIQKLLNIYAGKQIAVLDLGCGAGGFVQAVTKAGHFAVGLERSEYFLKAKHAAWSTIPERLITCDYSRPFSLYVEESKARRPALFQVVTAWELLQQIPEERLPVVLDNIRRHLHPEEGLFIASIHRRPYTPEGVEYYPTLRPEWWWRSLFLDHGFFPVDRALDYFDGNWARGPGREQNTSGSFHLVLTLSPAGPIVRHIDRLATQDLEDTDLSRVELKRLLEEEKRLRARMSEELSLLRRQQAETVRERDLLERKLKATTSFNWPNLCRVAAQAIERCRELGLRAVAFYGTGSHTEHLLNVWRNLGGPPVIAFLVTNKTEATRFGLPVLPVSEHLPPKIQGVVPSSHRFESEMGRIFRARHPKVPWISLWGSDTVMAEPN